MTEQPDLIERFFDALTVVGFAGLFACMVWLLLRPETTSRSYFPWFSGSGPNPQFFGARSQVSAVDADWPLFEKGDTFKYELNCHQIQLGANAGLFLLITE